MLKNKKRNGKFKHSAIYGKNPDGFSSEKPTTKAQNTQRPGERVRGMSFA